MPEDISSIKIMDLALAPDELIPQVAKLLVHSFDDAWPDLPSAAEEVQQSLQRDRVSRVALNDDGSVIGWISGLFRYARVWELHPLVVHSHWRKRGVGRALVEDFEQQVILRGGLTVTLGTDDEDDATSLSGVDLYENIANHIANFRIVTSHPSGFYIKMGYTITGVMPDANGLGKPDILMSKRVSR